MAAPLIVVEGSSQAFEHARHDLQRQGWILQRGWRVPVAPRARTILWGSVTGRDDGTAVVIAALDGLGVLVHARAERALIEQLCDDLRHVGVIERRIGEPLMAQAPALTSDAHELIQLLAVGITLGEAAQQLHMSRRTADRRLAEARSAYGVRSTPALLAAWARSRKSVEGG